MKNMYYPEIWDVTLPLLLLINKDYLYMYLVQRTTFINCGSYKKYSLKVVFGVI